MAVNINFRAERPPSAAVLEARGRRLLRASAAVFRAQWFVDKILHKIDVATLKRVRIATEYVKSRVVLNISRPVTKTYVTHFSGKKAVSYVHISDRSVPGEYPKADTTLLMKTIIGLVVQPKIGRICGYVGTPLDYGVVLELKMNRSFLLRTLNEERAIVMKMLRGRIL